MPNVPVEIRWSDESEREAAKEAIVDVAGELRGELDGLVLAGVPDEALPHLRDRKLSFSVTARPDLPDVGLAATAVEDLRAGAVSASTVAASGEDLRAGVASAPTEGDLGEDLRAGAVISRRLDGLVDEFARRALRVGTTKASTAFRVLGSPRKRLGTSLRGLDRDLRSMTARYIEAAGPTAVPDADGVEDALAEDAFVVRLTGPLDPRSRRALAAFGPLGDHEPPNTFRMVLTPQQRDAVSKLECVRGVRRYGLRDTLTPVMMEFLGRDSEATDRPAQFDVTVHVPESLERLVEIINGTPGVKIVDKGRMSLRFETKRDSPLLSAIAQLSIVRSLSPYEAPELYLHTAREAIGVEAIRQPGGVPGIPWDGSGEVAAVFDSGVDPGHVDIGPALAASPRAYGSSLAIDANGHGTHVIGIIAGRGVASDRVRGVAPGAKIASIGITDAAGIPRFPTELGDMLALALQDGARVINLSWGKKLHADYDVYGESIDRFLRDNPEVLVIVAAGNEGVAELQAGPRLGHHRARTIGMPAAAKNVLTVGACRSPRSDYAATWGQLKGSVFPDPPAASELVVALEDFPAAISSRGPTGFNSIKPDLLAPGTMILSARAAVATAPFVPHPLPSGIPPSAYGFLNGTSMAAPMVAGAALILRQYLRAARGTPTPTAALMRALLVLATRRISGANSHSILRDDPPLEVGFPDFDQGYGVLDLRRLLEHASAPASRKLALHDVRTTDSGALEARVEMNSERRSFRTYKVEVPEPTASDMPAGGNPLRFALSWTDPPGRGVQNVLSLEVVRPDGTKLQGNHEHRMFVDKVAEAQGETAHDKNNTTQVVTISDPQAGVYRITVRAEATTAPPQGYALAVSGPLTHDMLKPLF